MSKKISKSQNSKEVTADSNEIDWAAIAALEKQKHQEVAIQVAVASPEVLLSFDDWWMLREQAIGKPKHYKEILRVDSRARGLQKKDTLDRWDWAARQFGLSF